jgi:hypothetical protein
MTNTEITKPEAGAMAKSNSTHKHTDRNGPLPWWEEEIEDSVFDAEDLAVLEDFELSVAVRELQAAVDQLSDPARSPTQALTLANSALQRIRDLRLFRIEHGVSHASEGKFL